MCAVLGLPSDPISPARAAGGWLLELPAGGGGPGWWALLPWLLALALLLGGVALYFLARLARHAEEQRASARAQQDLLGELRDLLQRMETERSTLDLRRIEHLLIDGRDSQARLEDALLRSVERSSGPREERPSESRAPAQPADQLLERLHNRLLAMGYERIQVVTPRPELEALGERRAEVLVEARRAGVLHKGRVVLDGGRILDVAMQPPYALFP